jgi:predicted Zn finger-like uncharacterized protein
MAIKFVCESCQTTLRVSDELAGRSVRCGKCNTVCVVPAEEEEPVEIVEVQPAKRSLPPDEDDEKDREERPARRRKDDRPRRRPRPTGTNRGLMIGLIIGGGVLAGLFLVGVCGGLIWWYFLPENNPLLTQENIKKVQPGMSLEQAEHILGKSKQATEGDLQTVNKGMKGFGPAVAFRPGTTKYRWRNGNFWFFVDIDNNTKKIVGSDSRSYS